MPADPQNQDDLPHMRIVAFCVTFDPFIGGAEIAVKELTERLPNYRFDLITLRFDSKLPAYEEIGNICVHRVGFTGNLRTISDTYRLPLSLNKYLFPFFAYRKARKLRKEGKIDLIWSIMANYAGFAALLFKLRHPSVPFLLTLQEGDPEEHILRRVGIFSPFFRMIFSKANMVQTISHFLADFAVKMGYAGKPVVVPNGVDLAVFVKEYEPVELEELRRHLNQTMRLAEESGEGNVEEETYVVTASRLVRKNGIKDLIAAMQFLPKHVKLIVIGDGPLMMILRSLVAQYGLDSRIVFVGNLDPREIPKYFALSTVFARPSLSEGFGNAFIEAMAAGLPVVATPVGGIVDFVFDPVRNPDKKPTGLFAEPGNPQSIAKKIEILLNDDVLRERLEENARQMVVEKYDWNHVARLFDEKVLRAFIRH